MKPNDPGSLGPSLAPSHVEPNGQVEASTASAHRVTRHVPTEPVDRSFDRFQQANAARSGANVAVPWLPQKERRSPWGVIISFFVFVVLPVALASIYLFHFASDQYVAEFKFSVRSSSPAQSVSPQGITAALGIAGAGTSSNMTDNYAVVDYLLSRQAIEELQSRINVVNLYSKPKIDWWSRFNGSDPIESFVRYWQWRVTAQYDQVTGIADAQVRAFSPEDALLIAETMLKLSEELINRTVARLQADTVRFAEGEVRRGEARLKDIRAKLAAYRNKAGVIDPSASLVASNSQLAQTLRASIAQLETQMTSMRSQKLDPGAPVILALRSQIEATKHQLAIVERNVGQNPEGSNLSGVVGEFEQLDLERQLAQTMLTGAQQAYDQARAIAAAQTLYVVPFVRPYLPESATYPRRWLNLSLVAIISLVIWTFLLLVVRSLGDHYA